MDPRQKGAIEASKFSSRCFEVLSESGRNASDILARNWSDHKIDVTCHLFSNHKLWD